MRVLVVGGYGTFGARIVRLLIREEGVVPIVVGRNEERARAFATEVGSPCEFGLLDRDQPSNLACFSADLVIDASGPFQIASSYPLLRACLNERVNYVDLADGREFVNGISGFDEEAKDIGVFAISGASSYPALSFAAIRAIEGNFARVDEVRSGIAPSPQVQLGPNVIKAIVSYAGQVIPSSRGHSSRSGTGLVDAVDVTVGVPGCIPLARRRFLLVDTPDLDLLQAHFPRLRQSFTGAGTEPAYLQTFLRLLARTVSFGLLPSLSRFANAIHRARSLWPYKGEHRGGMFVSLSGVDHHGRTAEVSWNAVAEGDSGPYIPAAAAVAIVRRCIDGRPPHPGARSAAYDLDIEDFRAVLGHLPVSFGVRHDIRSEPESLYRRWLCAAFDSLPASLRAMHTGMDGLFRCNGTARVERGKGLLASIVARLVGFPSSGENIPVAVEFDCFDGEEKWTRDFAGRKFSSRQTLGTGKDEGLIVERFGPISVSLAPLVENGRLTLVVRRWRICGIPFPISLAPGGNTFEEDNAGVFRFHVEIGSRLTGTIVSYVGELSPPERRLSQ